MDTRSKMKPVATLLAVVGACGSQALGADEWKAGVAKVVVTPAEFVWMSGYPRTHPADGKLQDLWAKALAFEDPAGNRAVLITMDLIGIDRPTSRSICDELAARYQLQRRQVAINASHTHGGPVVGRNLDGMFSFGDDEWRKVEEYTRVLTGKLVALAGAAIDRLQPSKIAWSQGYCTIAVNRRENPRNDVDELRALGQVRGPSDYDLPVLTVRDEKGTLQAVVFGYACHPTTLDVSYKWSADYPGYAQDALEAAHPGALAMFWAGCGGDQAPRPRDTLALTEAYGRRVARAVDEVLAGVMRPVQGTLATEYTEIALRLDTPPSREELQANARSKNPYAAQLAQRSLAQLDAGKALRSSYPYPVQAWQLGELRWVFLGGEVVVDYALRLKRELGPPTWVAGYSNDVMAYIPSLRVLREGGYEGANAMVYYSFPQPWSQDVEAQIVEQVHVTCRQLPATTGSGGR
jgi:hypothetical protein